MKLNEIRDGVLNEIRDDFIPIMKRKINNNPTLKKPLFSQFFLMFVFLSS